MLVFIVMVTHDFRNCFGHAGPGRAVSINHVMLGDKARASGRQRCPFTTGHSESYKHISKLNYFQTTEQQQLIFCWPFWGSHFLLYVRVSMLMGLWRSLLSRTMVVHLFTAKDVTLSRGQPHLLCPHLYLRERGLSLLAMPWHFRYWW
jgi:hypothetical protein